jgi:hypothetical protein
MVAEQIQSAHLGIAANHPNELVVRSEKQVEALPRKRFRTVDLERRLRGRGWYRNIEALKVAANESQDFFDAIGD